MTEVHDQLTGLRNRSSFESSLREATVDAEGIALALIDLDHFKEINDTYGHAVGDQVLKRIAELLGVAAPGNAFRTGGDEFALILSDTTLEQAFLKMEALRQRALELDLPRLPSGQRITITIGVAQHPRDAGDARELLSAASAALVSAKESGRDQVCLPPSEKMVMKSCYYPASTLRKLQALAKQLDRKESRLLREALDDLLRKYDAPGAL